MYIFSIFVDYIVENAREEIHYQSNNITYVGDNQTSSPKFRWIDVLFLSALKAEDWVLLDEMNLTSQFVLEGLNSVLDQYRRIFISELNETFYCSVSFHIFMCQIRSYFHLPFNWQDKLKKWTKIEEYEQKLTNLFFLYQHHFSFHYFSLLLLLLLLTKLFL